MATFYKNLTLDEGIITALTKAEIDLTADAVDIATQTFVGRATAGTGKPEVLSKAAAKDILDLSGTNSGDASVTGQNYLSLSGQTITANPVDLSGTNVTGTLPIGKLPAINGGTPADPAFADLFPIYSAAASANRTLRLDYLGGFANPAICNFRLGLTSGVFTPSSDVTGAATLYFTPGGAGNRIALFDGTRWVLMSSSEVSIAVSSILTTFGGSSRVGTFTSGSPTVTSIGANTTGFVPGMLVTGSPISAGTYVKSVDSSTQITMSANAISSTTTSLTPYYALYDIFAYSNAGTLTLEPEIWANYTTRATALTLQDGVYLKTGATTRRYVGTILLSSTTTIEDSQANRLVWNLHNQIPRILYSVGNAGHTYNSATYRLWNNGTSTPIVQFATGFPGAVAVDLFNCADTQTATNVALDYVSGTPSGAASIEWYANGATAAQFIGYPLAPIVYTAGGLRTLKMIERSVTGTSSIYLGAIRTQLMG